MATPLREGRARLLGLDGLRAVSIALVMFGHATRTQGFPVAWRSLIPESVASNGVSIFFGLSGFLITWLLLSEESSRGSVSLAQFYFRRALRIFPAAYTYLAVMGACALAGWLPLQWKDVLSPAAFCANLIPISSWCGHFWSLSVEEQFYLVWPILFVRLRLRGRLVLALGWVLISPAWQHLNQVVFGSANINYQRPDLRFGPLMAGCALAILWHQVAVRNAVLPFLGRVRPWAWFLSMAGFTSDWWMPASLRGVGQLASIVLKNIGLTGMILLAVSGGQGVVSRCLNWGPVVWLGKLSYSLYLWQQVFCYPETGRWQERFPLNCVLTVIVAMISYYFIETPCLRWRDSRLRSWLSQKPHEEA